MSEFATKKEMKIEALNRMKKLELATEVIRDFEKDDCLYKSIGIGFLFYLNDDELTKIKEVEYKYGCLVYHAIKNYTEFGELLSLLIVTKYKEEWDSDRDDLVDGYVFSYVVNLDVPEFSEFGSITVVPHIGGLVRI